MWRDLTRFAAYAFCKAHAAGYGTLGWHSAYLKTHFPAEWAVGILNHHAGMYATWVHVEDLRRHGVEFRAPCTQRSTWDARLERDPDPASGDSAAGAEPDPASGGSAAGRGRSRDSEPRAARDGGAGLGVSEGHRMCPERRLRPLPEALRRRSNSEGSRTPMRGRYDGGIAMIVESAAAPRPPGLDCSTCASRMLARCSA